MRKRIVSVFAVLLVCSLVLPVAQAVSPRIGGSPRLSFNGTTATCYVTCYGKSGSDTVDATLTLYQGSTYVDSWSEEDGPKDTADRENGEIYIEGSERMAV